MFKPKDFATHEDLKEYIRKSVIGAKQLLPYVTQATCDYQVMCHLGYYQGYAAAKGWDVDILFLFDQISDLPPQSTPPTVEPITTEKKKDFKPSLTVKKWKTPSHDYGWHLSDKYRNN